MENYKVKERLGKGAQGSVYLVENRDDGKKYVLKKVECNDESEANRAFSEAVALKELQHPYVCGYKEFFVSWDKELSAMFVCIVMDYYENGDLSKIIRLRNSDGQKIEEELLKKWLGQIIESLVFVHKRKVIHRDLKPSNIFVQEDLSVCLGDFGVSTVMADARTKTRTTVGSMNWMAPEVLERPYDERSDVWSVGCIALELASCSFSDCGTMAGKLFEIKHNPQALEQLLQQVGQIYSANLVSLIRTALRRKFQQRPTAEELCEIPYVKECLALSNSALVERKRRQQTSGSDQPLPKDQDTEAALNYLLNHLGNETCVKGALEHLVESTREDQGASVDKTGKEIIAKAIKDYITEESIVSFGVQLLNNLVLTANVDDLIYQMEILSLLPLAMKTHPDSSTLQLNIANLFSALSAEESATEMLGTLGAIQDLLSAMRAFPEDQALIVACLSALWNLTVNEDNARIATEEKAVYDVVCAMNTHERTAEVLEQACAVLIALSLEDENLEVMNKLDCVSLILQAMERNMSEAKLVKNACMALAAMVEPDEESAFKVLSNGKTGSEEVQGILIAVKAYETHRDNAEVVENICTLLMELCEYEEIRAEIKHLKLADTILTEIHKRFKDNGDIMKPCEATLSKLGVNKNSRK